MKPLLSPAEVAELLDVTESTLADWRYRHRGPPFIKVERLVRYDQADLERYAQARRENGDPRWAAVSSTSRRIRESQSL